jgi:hypothetical protein
VEKAQARGEHQKRLALQQHPPAFGFSLVRVFAQTPRGVTSMTLRGTMSTEAIESRPNAAASQKIATKPNVQPKKPDSAAPATLPAWLKAWLRPFCRLKPRWRAMPSVIPVTAGPIAAPAMAVAICDPAMTQKLSNVALSRAP